MENGRRIINDNDPLEVYEHAAQHGSYLAPSPHVRGTLAVQPVSQTSVYKAQDCLYNAVRSVDDAAFITERSIARIFELDDQIQDARVRQSPLALTLAEKKLAVYARATDIFTEDHVERRLRQR